MFPLVRDLRFQTKLTYGMICYGKSLLAARASSKFQTKLTYGMICYKCVWCRRKRINSVSN